MVTVPSVVESAVMTAAISGVLAVSSALAVDCAQTLQVIRLIAASAQLILIRFPIFAILQ